LTDQQREAIRPGAPLQDDAGYYLTSICWKVHITGVESSFAIVAEPNRRAILSLLLASERSVGEIEQELRLSQPSVSKHLRVLRDAGFVQSRIEAQRRLYRLRPEPLMELDAWLAPFRRFWSKHVDALEQHLDTMLDEPSSGEGQAGPGADRAGPQQPHAAGGKRGQPVLRKNGAGRGRLPGARGLKGRSRTLSVKGRKKAT
jgi:DNA-binding transcriptional ArsR family regulator